MIFFYKKLLLNFCLTSLISLPVNAENLKPNSLTDYSNNNPNLFMGQKNYSYDVNFSEELDNNYITNSTSQIINPFGYKKGDWKKPIKWSSKYVKKGKYGDNVTIGIMDTAVNCSHKHLKTNSKRTCSSWKFNGSSFETIEGWQHGTNVAGVAAGAGGYGVAKNANIEGFAVFDDNGWYLTNDKYLRAVRFLVDNKNAKVLNWSFGADYSDGEPRPFHQSDLEAIKIAKNKALVVKAGGNSGKYMKTIYQTGMTKRYALKKYFNNMMWVGALNYEGKKLANFSAKPGSKCFLGSSEKKCTKKNKFMYYWLVAPGYVKSTDGSGTGINNTQGTSFSAPIVAGAAAVIKSRWPNLKPHEIRNILLKTATDMGKKGADSKYGRGKLNLTKALKPIKGKVGGVRIKGNMAQVFHRNGLTGDFSGDLKVIDKYDRTFQAVNYTSFNYTAPTILNIFNNDALSLSLVSTNEVVSSMGMKINGISIGNMAYISDVVPQTSALNFTETNDLISDIPHTLRMLNVSNQSIIYDFGDTMLFAMSPSNNSKNLNKTNSVGLKKVWKFEKGLNISSTVAHLNETGFHGLSSEKQFGFNDKQQSTFFQFGISQEHLTGIFGIDLNYHRTFESYKSANISWSDLSATQLQVGYSTKLLNGSLGFKVKSELITNGSFSSSIKGLNHTGNVYYEKPSAAINYIRQLNDLSTLDLNLSSENEGSIEVSYAVRF